MEVLALLIGLVGGSTAAAIWTTSREQAEKDRVLLLEAAREFMQSCLDASAALDALRRRTSEVKSRMDEWTAAREALTTAFEALDDEAASRALVDVPPLSFDLDVHRFDEGMTGAERQVLDEAVVEQLSRLEVVAAAHPVADEAVRARMRFARAAQAWARSSSTQRDTWGQWHRSYEQLGRRLPAIRLLFAREGVDDDVTKLAFSTSEAFGNAANAVSAEFQRDEDPGYANEVVTEAVKHAHRHIGAFSAAANARIRSRWWRTVWDAVGKLTWRRRPSASLPPSSTAPGG